MRLEIRTPDIAKMGLTRRNAYAATSSELWWARVLRVKPAPSNSQEKVRLLQPD